MTGMCAVDRSERRIFRASKPFDAGQIDVHQDHLRLAVARKFDAAIPVHCGQQADIGVARDDLLD